MQYRPDSISHTTLTLLLAVPLALMPLACSDDGEAEESTTETSGDGDGDGDMTGDGDGDQTGDGDGDPATGDGDGDPGNADFPTCSCDEFEGNCIAVTADDEDGLQVAANSLEDGDTLVLGLGVFELENQVTIRAEDITVCGQGKGTEGSFEEGTTLDFASQTTQSNGLDVVGDNFTVRDLAIVDAKKDGLRVEDSDNVMIQRVRATWRAEGDETNGSYGLYPVKVTRVTIEDSEAYNSSDAGVYVGQCAHAIVRNNIAKGNVAGIEIENTQYADVYGNLAEDNTGGLLIFDLPGNPIIGHDVSIHDNTIINNNRVNFAPGGTVREIPPGTGTFTMASRRVEIFNNTYENNGTGDIAILSGLVITEFDPEVWAIPEGDIVGDIEGVELPTGDGVIYNYATNNILIHDNTHSGSGMDPFKSGPDQIFGLLLAGLYADNLPIDNVIYDTVGESGFDPQDANLNSNENHICVGDSNEGGTFVSLNFTALDGYDNLFIPPSPFTPFDCSDFTMGPIVGPDMP